MTQQLKLPPTATEELMSSFAWPKFAGPIPQMGDWFALQQELVTAFVGFAQEAYAMMRTDMGLASDAMRRLATIKSPEELAAWQRDMYEQFGSKYLEQWMKLGGKVQGAVATAAAQGVKLAPAPAPAGVEAPSGTKLAA